MPSEREQLHQLVDKLLALEDPVITHVVITTLRLQLAWASPESLFPDERPALRPPDEARQLLRLMPPELVAMFVPPGAELSL